MKIPQAWFPHLGIEIYNLPRTLISVSGFNIYWYAVFIALGILAGLLYAVIEAKRTGQNPDIYMDYVTYGFIVSFIGARAYYVIFYWELYQWDLLKILNIREGGLAIYGGVIGAVLSAFFYCRAKKLGFGLLADTCAPGLILGQSIGRWGNFFNREAFGSYTDSLFALRYIVTDSQFVPAGLPVLDSGFANYIQVHPTFLYESVWNIGVFILLNIYKRHKKFDGEIFFLYLIGYGLGRFFIEGLRTDQLMLFGTGLAVSQLFSVLIFVFSLTWIFIKRRKGDNYALPDRPKNGE